MKTNALLLVAIFIMGLYSTGTTAQTRKPASRRTTTQKPKVTELTRGQTPCDD